MMQGYTLQETQCGKCEMPMMEYKGKVNCVVCPALDKAEKKKVTGLADKRRHKKETQDQLDELRRTEVAEEEELGVIIHLIVQCARYDRRIAHVAKMIGAASGVK